MALFFPEWIPWWLQLVIVGAIVIFGFCFLLMPFSVLGLKSRLTYLDHQMEDIQSQLRVLLKRVPDARERLEFKLQPIPTGENEVAREDVVIRGKNQKNSTSEYYEAVPSMKNRPTRFDPPSKSDDSFSSRNYEKPTSYDDGAQYSSQDRFLQNREPVVSGADQRNVNPIRKEEQLYDPPGRSVKEEKQGVTQPRRRAEPILRWPPR